MYDALDVDGVSYCGSDKPDGVVPGKSDASVSGAGFAVSLEENGGETYSYASSYSYSFASMGDGALAKCCAALAPARFVGALTPDAADANDTATRPPTPSAWTTRSRRARVRRARARVRDRVGRHLESHSGVGTPVDSADRATFARSPVD